MLTPYKLKGRLQHRDAVRLPLMTDFIVVRQHSSPYVWNQYQVLSLPANTPAHTSGINIGFKVSAAPAGCRLLSYTYYTQKKDF